MGTPDIYPVREDSIAFEILELLLACPNLVYVTTHNSLPNTINILLHHSEFTLSHDYPVDITQSQIENMASQ